VIPDFADARSGPVAGGMVEFILVHATFARHALRTLDGSPLRARVVACLQRALPGWSETKSGVGFSAIWIAELRPVTNAPPSLRVRGEGRDEGAFRLGSELRQRPLTRIASQSDLSPHAGRGERQRIMRAARVFQKNARVKRS